MKSVFVILAMSFSVMTFSQTNYTEELQKVSSQIESIRVKRDWIKNDPVEDSIAVAQEWYAKMEDQLDALFDKKRNLIRNETGKRWVSIEEFEEIKVKKQQILLADDNFVIEGQ